MKSQLLLMLGLVVLIGCDEADAFDQEIPQGQAVLLNRVDHKINELGEACSDSLLGDATPMLSSSESRWTNRNEDTSYTKYVYAAWIDPSRHRFKTYEEVGDLRETSSAHPDVIYCVVERLDMPVERRVRERTWNPVALSVRVPDDPQVKSSNTGVTVVLEISAEEQAFQQNMRSENEDHEGGHE